MVCAWYDSVSVFAYCMLLVERTKFAVGGLELPVSVLRSRHVISTHSAFSASEEQRKAERGRRKARHLSLGSQGCGEPCQR